MILQADHLITCANAATYADSRLVVCVCKAHLGWKSLGSNMRKAQYETVVKQVLPPERLLYGSGARLIVAGRCERPLMVGSCCLLRSGRSIVT